VPVVDDPGGPGPVTGPGGPAMDLHAEQLTISTERVAVERVRFTKRIVTTTRTIEVPVPVEQLVVQREPLDPTGATVEGAPDRDEFVIVLHEEVPEVTVRVVPTERVVVRVRTVAGEERLTADLATEVADVVVDLD